MAAQLAATVYVKDPDTKQTVELAEGSSPENRLAALVTNPAAWVDGKLPRLPKAKDSQTPDGTDSPPSGGPDDASGDASATTSDGADPDTPEPAAKKTAARKPARGRSAADEGTGGA